MIDNLISELPLKHVRVAHAAENGRNECDYLNAVELFRVRVRRSCLGMGSLRWVDSLVFRTSFAIASTRSIFTTLLGICTPSARTCFPAASSAVQVEGTVRAVRKIKA